MNNQSHLPQTQILLKVLKKQIETKVEAINHLGDNQFGFQRGRGTRVAIGLMRVICERNIECWKNVCVFCGLLKDIQENEWPILFKALKRLGTDWRDRRLNRNRSIYEENNTNIRIEGDKTEINKKGIQIRLATIPASI